MKIDLSTEGLARSSARRPWVTIAIWLVLIAAAIAINATLLEDALTTEFSFTNDPDSERANTLLEERLRGPRKINEVVIVQSEELTVEDDAFRKRVLSLNDELLALNLEGGEAKIGSLVNYYITQEESMVSADRRTTIMPLTMTGMLDDATRNVEGVFEIVVAANGRDGFKVLIIGESSAAFEGNELSVKEIKNGEKIGVPIALIILLFLFGAVLAALIPIGLAGVAIVVALGATALVGQVVDLIFFVTIMIVMIGLAVGIDYSLLVVSRFRDELRRGLARADAIARTGATASRTVLFSGGMVVVALGGMLIVPATIFQSLAIGAILVVLAAVAVSLTLLPAILSLLGDRINALRLPFIGRRLDRGASQEGGGFWGVLTRVVMGHPVVGLLVVGGALIAAASPVLDLNASGFNGLDTYPDGVQIKEAFLLMEKEFYYGVVAPTEIVIDGDLSSPAVQAGIDKLQASIEADGDFVAQQPLVANEVGDLGLLQVHAAGEVSSDQAVTAIRRLRDDYIPTAFGDGSADVLVTGFTAFNVDFFDVQDRFLPIVFAAVLSMSFVLLTIVFRSIVVPIKAIFLNLLSVGAAYGLLVLVFQKGFAADLLGFQTTDVIDAWIPLFLFSVLFGLSMDYHIFLISRIRERYDETKDNTDAVSYGLRSTAGLITGAALIMVAVFSGFALGDLVSNQQVGFGLAAAILIDATLVRSVLVPASMRLLGDWNWYLPPGLRWLPALRVESEAPVPTPSAGGGGGGDGD